MTQRTILKFNGFLMLYRHQLVTLKDAQGAVKTAVSHLPGPTDSGAPSLRSVVTDSAATSASARLHWLLWRPQVLQFGEQGLRHCRYHSRHVGVWLRRRQHRAGRSSHHRKIDDS